MAKKKSGRKKVKLSKQSRIEGTYDPPPKKLVDIAEDYANALANRVAISEEVNTLRASVVELMREHNVESIELATHKLELVHTERDNLKLLKLKQPEPWD